MSFDPTHCVACDFINIIACDFINIVARLCQHVFVRRCTNQRYLTDSDSHLSEGISRRLDGALDILLTVSQRDENSLKLRGRQVDALF